MILVTQKYRSAVLLLIGMGVLYIAGALITLHIDPTNRSYVSSIALPFDFMIFIPAVFYFFVLRKHKLTPLLVVPVIWLGSLIVTQVIQPYDMQFVLMLMAVTLAAEIVIAILESRRIMQCYKLAKVTSTDPRIWFRETLFSLTRSHKVSRLASAELTAMWYALLSWKKAPVLKTDAETFSYHKKSGYASLVGVLLGVSVIEIAAVHLLLSQFSTVAATIVIILSVYTMLWLLGDLRASILRPIKIGKSFLEVNSGLKLYAEIPLEKIESIDTKVPQLNKKEMLNLGMFGESNCWIILKEEIVVEGMLGTRSPRRAIGLTLDNAPEFRSALTEHLRIIAMR